MALSCEHIYKVNENINVCGIKLFFFYNLAYRHGAKMIALCSKRFPIKDTAVGLCRFMHH